MVKGEVFILSVETVRADEVILDFDDQITSAVLTITDNQTGSRLVLDSRLFSKLPKPSRVAAEAFFREFGRKIGMDWVE